jgi:hypothetical protein
MPRHVVGLPCAQLESNLYAILCFGKLFEMVQNVFLPIYFHFLLFCVQSVKTIKKKLSLVLIARATSFVLKETWACTVPRSVGRQRLRASTRMLSLERELHPR